jgi:hypothetical protein
VLLLSSADVEKKQHIEVTVSKCVWWGECGEKGFLVDFNGKTGKEAKNV